MIDIKLLRSEPERLKAALSARKEKFDLDALLELDKSRRSSIMKAEQLKARQNEASKKIPALKKAGEDTAEIFAQMKAISDEIAGLDGDIRERDEEIEKLLLTIPNIPNPTVPPGDTDEDNVEIRRWGEPPVFDGFEPLPHWDLSEKLDIVDAARAAKVTGARFVFYKGAGAALERAIVNFFLDTHIQNGYTEVFPPFMVSRRSMTGTGQLPKFEEDAFKLSGEDYFLVPTAEVPVTNMYRDEILDGKSLPIKHAAYSACFRAEAGSAGRDSRGLIRQHQFNKVELVKFTRPEDSYAELEALTRDAEGLLLLLGIPYRVVKICMGDLGFTAAMKYDIEVWMPSYNRYVEISSCSNFEDFQSRRANIRFKDSPADKVRLIHTINGSGLAIGRTTAAILENFQNADGSVTVPEVLRQYMRMDKIG